MEFSVLILGGGLEGVGGFDGCLVTFLTFSFHYYEHYDRLCYSICIYMYIYIYIQGRVGGWRGWGGLMGVG